MSSWRPKQPDHESPIVWVRNDQHWWQKENEADGEIDESAPGQPTDATGEDVPAARTHRAPAASRRSVVQLPDLPRWMYLVLGSICVMACISIVKTMTGSGEDKDALASAEPGNHAPSPRPSTDSRRGRGTASGRKSASSSFRIRPISRDLAADLAVQHARSTILTALRLGESSGLLDLSPQELNIFKNWLAQARSLGVQLRVTLKPAKPRPGSPRRHGAHGPLAFKLALDENRGFLGVVYLDWVDDRLSIVGARSFSQR